MFSIIKIMRVLGIDPGYGIVGFGVIDSERYGSYNVVDYGVINTPKEKSIADRITQIYDGMIKLIETFKPDALAVEELFFNTNITTGIKVAEARGVILLAGRKNNLPTYEYTPLQIKQALTGQGRAEKTQVQFMVKSILGLSAIPRTDDAADALAVAICQLQTNNLLTNNLV